MSKPGILRGACSGVVGTGALATALLLGACSSQDIFEVHDDFQGIESLYEKQAAVSVLVVHGMGEHRPGYSGSMQGKIAASMGMSTVGTLVDQRRLAANGVELGLVTKTMYRQANGGSRRLTMVELSWSEATMPIKTLLLDLDPKDGYKEKGELEKQRVWVNSYAKRFVNTHFSDPILYVGAFRPVLQDLVWQAICIMYSPPPAMLDDNKKSERCSFAEAKAEVGELSIITASLGSALVFDAAVELFGGSEAEKIVAQKLVKGTKSIFMFANQLPLIELRELRAVTGKDWLDGYPCPRPSKDEAGAGRRQRGGLRDFLIARHGAGAKVETLDPKLEGLTVVAFNDPNDVLTYGLTNRFKEACKPAYFANVTVTNAETRWLFIVADPFEAHTGYERNDRVIDLVVKGRLTTPKNKN